MNVRELHIKYPKLDPNDGPDKQMTKQRLFAIAEIKKALHSSRVVSISTADAMPFRMTTSNLINVRDMTAFFFRQGIDVKQTTTGFVFATIKSVKDK